MEHNKIIVIFTAVLLVVIGIFGYVVSRAIETTNTALGVNLTYSSALSRLETYNLFDALIADNNNMLRATGQTLTGSGSYSPGVVSTSTQASTTITVTGAAVGDFAIAEFGTTTDVSGADNYNKYGLDAKVSAANTVHVLFHSVGGNTTTTLGSATLRVKVFPNTTTTLSAATTTAANR